MMFQLIIALETCVQKEVSWLGFTRSVSNVLRGLAVEYRSPMPFTVSVSPYLLEYKAHLQSHHSSLKSFNGPSMKVHSPIFFCLPIVSTFAYPSNSQSGLMRKDVVEVDDGCGSQAFLCPDDSGGCCPLGFSCTQDQNGNPACQDPNPPQ